VKGTIIQVLIVVAIVAQPVFLFYFLLYNTYTLSLVILSARQVRRRVAGHFVEDLDLIDRGDLTKPLTMIVPAFNEEVTIVDSVTNLVHCDYPRHEIVVINDGSSDRTLDRLKQAFRLRRTDIPYREAIGTARVRGMYEATIPLPPGLTHLVVIDKENGGKADALNAGINASTAPYFVSLDADSILDQRALKELMRVVQQDPRVVAVGGQVAIANGCTIRNSRVVKVGLPARPLARFQMVEYLRSFTTGRTGLDRMDAILILSGVFAVFEKETVIRAGGYLTPFVRSRITEEYVGRSVGTVCEDMEIIVRLHRFVRDKLQDRRIAFLPHPVAWTEVPETMESLRKQRGRWYRGLRESLPSSHAVAEEVRADRLVRAAHVLDLRVSRPAGRAVRLRPHSLPGLHGAPAGLPIHQLRVPLGLPARLAGLWRAGECLRGPGGRLAVPARARRSAAARAPPLQPPPGRADSAGVRGAREPRISPAHAVLAAARTLGCVAGEDRVGKIRPRGVPRRGSPGAWLTRRVRASWSSTTTRP
jgi:cellulose synthase/poly-beta-1,6-N-acetylglucosamine synthase-like glycosyltransferase